ncbi:MAG TPA: hypothetical protein VL101_12325, partial [Nordella sp.]|nr:hypothetical protein [Nordella sp.]
YRFGVALILVVSLHEIIEQGAIATRSGGASPYLTMWLPFLAVTAFAAWRFWSASFALQPDQLDRLIDRLATAVRRLFRNIFSRGEAA